MPFSLIELKVIHKKNGKKALHIGAITQIYFGIKGKRYETKYNDY